MKKIKIKKSNINQRLDVFLVDDLKETRSKVKHGIEHKKILVNGEHEKAGYLLKENDEIEVENFDIETSVLPENIKLDIVYEDNYIMVVNKPSGMVVHPGNGNYFGTLVNGLMYYTKHLSKENGDMRPGIVHRIDKDTSGLLLIAKTDEVHNILSEEFKKHNIKRKYIALVKGVLEHNNGKIDAPIGRDNVDRKKFMVTDKNGKKSITNFKVLERYKDATLIELSLKTGRTHQIRVHMNYIGHPVVNDPVYGRRKLIDDSGQCLHAKTLGFIHPTLNKYMEFDSELPDCFINILNKFKEE